MRKHLKVMVGLSMIATSLLITSCGSEKAETATTTQDTVATASAEAKPADPADDFFSKLPSASAIPTLLERTGAEYNKALPNKSGKAAAYSTSSAKAAANLGIYGADMAYLCAYEKNKDAQAYVTDIQKLAEHLNANDAFGAAMIERMKQNLENNDSLMALTEEGIKLANQLLKQSERKADAFMIGTGGYIEGLYIATGLVESFPRDMKPEARDLILLPLTRTIIEQKQQLKDLVTIGQSITADPEIDALKKELGGLLEVYEKLNFEEQLKNNKGDLILGDATLKSIVDKVKSIRAGLVK